MSQIELLMAFQSPTYTIPNFPNHPSVPPITYFPLCLAVSTPSF